MKRIPRLILLIAAALAGCSPDLESFAQRIVDEDERAFSIAYLRGLQEGAVDSAYALLAPELQAPETRTQLEGAEEALQGVPLDSLELIGANVASGGGVRQVNLSYEGQAADRYVVMNVATRQDGGDVRVVGFSARPNDESLFVQHAFRLSEKSLLHMAWLVLAMLSPVICVAAAVTVFRTTGMPKRWLWVVIALLAAPTFALNWTTGFYEARWLTMSILGAGMTRSSGAAPWVLVFGSPVGAALAVWRRKRWLTQTHGSAV